MIPQGLPLDIRQPTFALWPHDPGDRVKIVGLEQVHLLIVGVLIDRERRTGAIQPSG